MIMPMRNESEIIIFSGAENQRNEFIGGIDCAFIWTIDAKIETK